MARRRPYDEMVSTPTDSDFLEARPRLFGIAYRMLGSATEAEDVVQEVWLRWQQADRSDVREPAAFLATIATRLSINAATTARARHETYIGPWLPDPVDTSADPSLGAERGEALELAVLLLLERLTPSERAAYVLREAFDYPYPLIAEIVQQAEPTVRKSVSRAKEHLATERKAPVSQPEHRRLLNAFLAAARIGDVGALEKLLSTDVVSFTDGGGVRQAARIPVLGRERVAQFVGAFAGHFWTGASIHEVVINGATGFALRRDDETFALLSITASESGIDQLLWMMNPQKISTVTVTEANPALS